MAELERELLALAESLDLPADRDLVDAVRARLAERPRRLPRWRMPAAVVAAILVVAFGVTMAVPDARSAVLRWLGLQSVSVIRVEKLPPATTGAGVFGERVSLSEAGRIVGFRVLLPDLGEPPDDVRVNRFTPDFVVLLYGRPRRLRLTEFRSSEGFVQKFATADQPVESVRVNGGPGLWIEGRHVVSELFGLPRFSGNVLLWERGRLTLRLEGNLTREQALEIAKSVK